MAEIEIASMLESLVMDSHRCAPVAASVVRRRGDRRRVAVRAVATGSSVVLVGATAGTAYAVGQGSGAESLHTRPASHQSPSPAPVPPHHRQRELERKLKAASARLEVDRAALSRLHARHRAGQVTDRKYQAELQRAKRQIALDHHRIQELKAKLGRSKAAAAPAAVQAPTPSASTSPASAAPATSPAPISVVPVPSASPTAG